MHVETKWPKREIPAMIRSAECNMLKYQPKFVVGVTEDTIKDLLLPALRAPGWAIS